MPKSFQRGLLLVWLIMLGLGAKGEEEAHELALEIKTWKVSADFIERLLEGPPESKEESAQVIDPFAAGGNGVGCRFHYVLPRTFEIYYKISFPSGSTCNFSPNRGELVVNSSRVVLERIDNVIKSLGPMEAFELDSKLFHPLVELILNGASAGNEVVKWEWFVAPEVMDFFVESHGCEDNKRGDPFAPSDPFGDDKKEAEGVMKKPELKGSLEDVLMEYGVPVKGPRRSIHYDRTTGTLTSVNERQSTLVLEMIFLECAVSFAQDIGKSESRADDSNR